jgi:hypothetical protein
MNQGIREMDGNLWDQAKRERRMMLAWYLGVTSLMLPLTLIALNHATTSNDDIFS